MSHYDRRNDFIKYINALAKAAQNTNMGFTRSMLQHMNEEELKSAELYFYYLDQSDLPDLDLS